MDSVRKALLADYLEICEILDSSLPHDPILKLIKSLDISKQYCESLIKSNDVYLFVDKKIGVLGIISIGNLKTVIRNLLHSLSFQMKLKFFLSILGDKNIKSFPLQILLLITGRYLPSRNEITWIAVKENFRSQGIGKSLIYYAAHERLDANHEILVKTLSSTPENVLFYQSCGFMIQHTSLGRVILKGDPNQICSVLKMQKN